VIRINLLPPEITQKRKDERRWQWVVIGGIVVAVVFVGVFALLQLQVSMKQGEVASVKQQAAVLTEQAQRFQIFQEKQADLTNRRAIVAGALAGRVDWSRLLSEVALVLPSDIYLTQLGATQPAAGAAGAPGTPGQFTMAGRALDVPNDVPDLGYKSIAKLLSRLADLQQLDAVWLTDSTKPAVTTPGSTTTATYFITFGLSAEVAAPTTATVNSPGVPAPPSQ
jgi:Tfp pilus assembly protein PilN